MFVSIYSCWLRVSKRRNKLKEQFVVKKTCEEIAKNTSRFKLARHLTSWSAVGALRSNFCLNVFHCFSTTTQLTPNYYRCVDYLATCSTFLCGVFWWILRWRHWIRRNFLTLCYIWFLLQKEKLAEKFNTTQPTSPSRFLSLDQGFAGNFSQLVC